MDLKKVSKIYSPTNNYSSSELLTKILLVPFAPHKKLYWCMTLRSIGPNDEAEVVVNCEWPLVPKEIGGRSFN